MKVIKTGLLGVNSLIIPVFQNKVFVIDPADCSFSQDKGTIVNYLKSCGLECIAILLTHSHFDHITGLDTLKQAFPSAPIAVHSADFNELVQAPGPMNISVLSNFGLEELYPHLQSLPSPDIKLTHLQTLENIYSDSLPFSVEIKKALSLWKVLNTPGHTPGSCCFYNREQKLLISGDTLFYQSYGRTDMYGGNEVDIKKSLNFLSRTIKSGTKVYPGHDYYGFEL